MFCGGIVGLPDSRVTSLLLSRLDKHDGTMTGVEKSHLIIVRASVAALLLQHSILATLAGVKKTAWPVDMVAAAGMSTSARSHHVDKTPTTAAS